MLLLKNKKGINMKKKPVIVTDVDSVLLDWLQGFAMFLQNEKDIDVKHVKKFFGTSNFIDIPEITSIPCLDTNKLLVKEYGKSKYIEELKAFQEDSKQHILELHKEVDFIALSCISKNRQIINKRKRNLQSVYGDIFKDVICIGFGQSKEFDLIRLKEQENVITFIDDREKHIKESISAGIKPILFKRGLENIEHCPENSYNVKTCWSDIKESILIELELKNKISIKSKKNKIDRKF